MTISWKKNTSPNLILDQLQNSKIKNSDGSIKFEAFNYDIFTTILFNILDFPTDISEVDARSMISAGIRNIELSKRITKDNILKELNLLERKYRASPLKRYVLVSSISLNRSIIINRIYLDRNIVVIENNLTNRFISDNWEKLIKKASTSIYADLPKDYSYVRVHVSSQSIYDAANQALDSIDFIRGIWNWVINKTFTYRKTFIGSLNPINKLILGPIHTIHNIEGELLTNNEWWYEPSYLGAIKTYNPNPNDLNILIKSQTNIRKAINRIQYSKDLRSTLIRYTRALDERDMTSSYIKLWGILEFLTDTHHGSSHNVTVKRIASLYEDQNYNSQVLRILKEYRNSYVHSGNETNEIETYLVRLKNYVDTMLHFHITNKFHFKSIENAAEFLDLPASEHELIYKMKLYKYAKTFRHLN